MEWLPFKYLPTIKVTKQKLTTSDHDIIKAIRTGKDQVILSQLYQTIFPSVKARIIKAGGDEDEAKDIFQESILVFYKKVIKNEYDNEYAIGAFISGVAKNMWLNRFRKKSKSTELMDYHHSSVGVSSTYNYIYDDERASIIKTIFADLGDVCKELLEAVVYHGYSMKEVANQLNFTNENVAKTKHYKCKQRLIKRLKHNNEFKQLLQVESI